MECDVDEWLVVVVAFVEKTSTGGVRIIRFLFSDSIHDLLSCDSANETR